MRAPQTRRLSVPRGVSSPLQLLRDPLHPQQRRLPLRDRVLSHCWTENIAHLLPYPALASVKLSILMQVPDGTQATVPPHESCEPPLGDGDLPDHDGGHGAHLDSTGSCTDHTVPPPARVSGCAAVIGAGCRGRTLQRRVELFDRHPLMCVAPSTLSQLPRLIDSCARIVCVR